jgi:Tfp pilus assembly protein PilN
MLNDISSAVPQKCWLERIEQQENKKQLNVTGYAANIDKAVEFTEMLSGKKANLKTELTELKTEELNGKQYTAFNVLIERR